MDQLSEQKQQQQQQQKELIDERFQIESKYIELSRQVDDVKDELTQTKEENDLYQQKNSELNEELILLKQKCDDANNDVTSQDSKIQKMEREMKELKTEVRVEFLCFSFCISNIYSNHQHFLKYEQHLKMFLGI